MRQLTYAINITLDGCVDHVSQQADDEKMEYFAELVRGFGLQLFGRKTYELMVPYWPDVAKDESASKADRDYARAFNSVPKLVFSRSLESVADPDTRIVRANLREEILKLKQEPGKHLLIGGVDVSSQLIELGLVDEYIFVVSPVIAGAGRRLLDGVKLAKAFQLKLVDSHFFKSGSVAHRYSNK
jgi:dihydrofolate reductase